jgi:hypothetical protein
VTCLTLGKASREVPLAAMPSCPLAAPLSPTSFGCRVDVAGASELTSAPWVWRTPHVNEAARDGCRLLIVSDLPLAQTLLASRRYPGHMRSFGPEPYVFASERIRFTQIAPPPDLPPPSFP